MSPLSGDWRQPCRDDQLLTRGAIIIIIKLIKGLRRCERGRGGLWREEEGRAGLASSSVSTPVQSVSVSRREIFPGPPHPPPPPPPGLNTYSPVQSTVSVYKQSLFGTSSTGQLYKVDILNECPLLTSIDTVSSVIDSSGNRTEY